MGVVYIAEHAELDRKVALKLLLPGGQNKLGVARFQVEARATARLNHPNIVRIFDVGEDPAGHYFAMDLVDGESLSDTIKTSGKLRPRRAAEIAKKLAEALSYAHTHAILHRDMKPANVLMRADGEPVVTDFGLAKDVREKGLTVTGQVMGTPAYMPPEQAEGDTDQVDRRSDVYSIGATLFEMLTGQPPFKGQTPLHVLRQVLTDPAPRPSNFVPKLDPDLETICLKCLEKEPGQRYLSARALGEDLGLWLRDLPIRAKPPTLGRRLSSWGRRNRTLVGIMGGAACLLLAGGVWTLLQVTEARVRAELEREAGLKQGREQASAELIGAARSAVEERRSALAAAPRVEGDATPRAREAAEQERVARALDFNNAALRWRAIAPESKEAKQACFEGAMALGEATQAAKQWGPGDPRLPAGPGPRRGRRARASLAGGGRGGSHRAGADAGEGGRATLGGPRCGQARARGGGVRPRQRSRRSDGQARRRTTTGDREAAQGGAARAPPGEPPSRRAPRGSITHTSWTRSTPSTRGSSGLSSSASSETCSRPRGRGSASALTSCDEGRRSRETATPRVPACRGQVGSASVTSCRDAWTRRSGGRSWSWRGPPSRPWAGSAPARARWLP